MGTESDGVSLESLTRPFHASKGTLRGTALDSYGDVTAKAMAMAMERVPRVDV